MSHFKSFSKAVWLSHMLCSCLEKHMYTYCITAEITCLKETRICASKEHIIFMISLKKGMLLHSFLFYTFTVWKRAARICFKIFYRFETTWVSKWWLNFYFWMHYCFNLSESESEAYFNMLSNFPPAEPSQKSKYVFPDVHLALTGQKQTLYTLGIPLVHPKLSTFFIRWFVKAVMGDDERWWREWSTIWYLMTV